ncbi:MAG: Cof-type HAD-IIB family hydrolase [Bacillota bacterium]
MKRYLIALDLDGTLLYDWSTLDEKTKDYLLHIKSLGHRLVIATGRPHRSSIRYYDALELDTPLINYNGGLITWASNPDFKEVSILLDRDKVVDIFTQNEDNIENAFCEIKDDIFLLEESDDIVDLLHFFGAAKLHIGAFKNTLPADTNGCIIVAKNGRGQAVEDYVKAHYEGEIMTRNWGDEHQSIIELFTPLTNKGRALAHVAKTLGIPQERTIAFGDGHNDLEMLQYAHIGVAMKNAHPDLKEVADVISPFTNKEHAIVRFLKNTIPNEKVDQD